MSRALANAQTDCLHKSVGRLTAHVTLGVDLYDWNCTGTYIGNRWVVTAAHCLTAGDCRTSGQNSPTCAKAHRIDLHLHDQWYEQDTGTFLYLHPDYRYEGAGSGDDPTEDIALFRISEAPETKDPTVVWPMPVAASSPPAGTQLTVVGVGCTVPQVQCTPDFIRRMATSQVMAQSDPTELHSSSQAILYEGDSGGPSFLLQGGQEYIAGTHSSYYQGKFEDMNAAYYRTWIDGTCGNCVTGWQAPPSGYDPEDTKTAECSKDDDGDSIINRRDNCPNVENRDQINCNESSDPYLHADQQLHGDACDPTPCAYIEQVQETVFHSPYGTVKQAGPVEIFSRAVGYTATQDYTHVALEAFYCSCNDPGSQSPYQPDQLSEIYCRSNICKQDGSLNFNTATDQGWQYAAWEALADGLTAPALPKTTCTLVDDEQDGHSTQCNDPVPSRLFRKPYAGTVLGKSAGDWDKYWKEPTQKRIRQFTWHWHKQDFPHPMNTLWTPPGPQHLPTFNSSSYVWFHPEDSDPQRKYNNRYSDLRVLGFFLQPNLPEELLKPLRYQVPETVYLPGPPISPQVPSTLQLLVHPLAAGRPSEGVEPYLWGSPPANSATIGMVVKLYNPTNGDLGEAWRSTVVAGTPPNTAEFALAQWQDDLLYIFGGRTLDSERPAMLWRGWREWDPVLETSVYKWSTEAQGGPPGRTGAVLVADPDRHRLLLLLGQAASGAVADLWSYDLATHAWTQQTLQVPGLLPSADSGFCAQDGKLLIYGGRDGETFRQGLYEVDLATLAGQRVDVTSDPGGRSGTALRYDPGTRTLLLFGGRDSQGLRGDLWYFDREAQAWSLVAAQGAPGGPPPMEHAVVATCSFSGAVSVIAGQVDGGSAPEPAWRLRHGVWEPFSVMMGAEP